MKYRFALDKRPMDVEIATTATFHSPTEVRVGKRTFEVQAGEAADGHISSFFVDNHHYMIEVVSDEDGYPKGILVNDEYYPASLVKIDQLFYYKEKEVATARSGVVRSFIPGFIQKIYFSPGDRVSENDIVLIHEAMKMENEIRAPRSGVLKSIGVAEGDNILAGHLLFEVADPT